MRKGYATVFRSVRSQIIASADAVLLLVGVQPPKGLKVSNLFELQAGAVEKTRTSTAFRPPGPQPGASTNSATTALCDAARGHPTGPRGVSNKDRPCKRPSRRSNGGPARPRALSGRTGGHGTAGQRDPRPRRPGAGLAATASSALHGRHQRRAEELLDAAALPGLRGRPRRPLHLSRAGPAHCLRDARSEAARRGFAALRQAARGTGDPHPRQLRRAG